MVVAVASSFTLRQIGRSWHFSSFAGIATYYICVGGISIFTSPSTHEEQLGWFLFICILLLPRALLAAVIGLVSCHIYRFVKQLVQPTKNHG